jgi:hypothetical protein
VVTAGPRFVQARQLPGSFLNETIQWYGECVLSEGSRAIYVGAKSSDGLATYRFMADFSPGAAPRGNGVVTGKLTGVEKIPETVTFNGKTRMGYASLPLVTEAALQPAGNPGVRLEVEIVEVSPPAAPNAPAAAQNPPLTKEQQAIALLGTDTSAAVHCVQRYTRNGPKPFEGDEASRAREDALAIFRKEGPVTGLRAAATLLAKFRDRAQFTITVVGDGAATIAALQAILGRESMRETKGVFAGDDFADTGAPSDPRVTWYHYGWLVFGTANGKVLGVRVDFQKFGGGPVSAPGK